MTRLLITSDWHADHVSMGVPRYEEIAAAVRTTVTAAIDEKADAYLFLGDLCDPDPQAPAVMRSVSLAIDAATMLAVHDIPSLWLAGNHDTLEDGSGDTVLTPMRSLANFTGHCINVVERPGLYSVRGIEILALPFTASSHAYDSREVAKNSKGRIVVGHLNVPGIIPGEELTEMPRGRDVVFPLKETAGARARLHGHYHRQQSFDPKDGGPPIHIPGSLGRLTFGEGDHVPGYLVLDV